jgi:hypothetical protein
MMMTLEDHAPRPSRLRRIHAIGVPVALVGACTLILALGLSSFCGPSASAYVGGIVPSIESASVNYTPAQSGLHDTCSGEVSAEACEKTLTVIEVHAKLPPGAGEDCEGPAVVGYASNISGAHLSTHWPGGDWESNCGAVCSSPSAECSVVWNVYPFAYAGTPGADCIHKEFAVEVSLEYLGNGEGYSTAYPIPQKIELPSGCKASGAQKEGAQTGGAPVAFSLQEGEARIRHADGSEESCGSTGCRVILFGVGDTVTTGSSTYLIIDSNAGRYILGPNTRVTVTKTFLEYSGGEARFELTRAPCKISTAVPTTSGHRLLWLAPKRCKGADVSLRGSTHGVEVRDNNNGQVGVLDRPGKPVELKRTGELTRIGRTGPPTPPHTRKLQRCPSTADRNAFEFLFCLPFHR